MNTASSIVDQAIAWHLRQDTMLAADWAAFIAWLEDDAEHARVYDAVARQDRLVAGARFPAPVTMPAAANDDAPIRRWLWGAGAAGIAAALALWVSPSPFGGSDRRFVTRNGERRAVTLADGSQIAMNGGTAVAVAPGGRSARLERGEVMLRVVHNAATPFVLYAGDQAIEDVGTRFDVTRTDVSVVVAVAEGAVALPGAGPTIRLQAGDALRIDTRSGAAIRTAVAPETVGGWRSGKLSFASAPLADVAAALRRREGLDLTLEGDLSRRPFTGIVRLTGIADRDIPHLADLIGATWRRDGKRWVLAEHSAKTN